MLRRLFPILTILSLSACGGRTNEYIRLLDETLERKDFYEKNFLDRIDVLSGVMTSTRDTAQIYEIRKRIAVEYYTYNMNSALACLQLNRQLGEDTGNALWVAESDIMMANVYTTAGYYLEAKGVLDAIDPASLPAGGVVWNYYYVRYSLTREYLQYTTDVQMRISFEKERDRYMNLLLETGDTESWEYHKLLMEQADIKDDGETATYHAHMLVELSPEYSHNYAIGCYFCYEHTDPGDLDTQKSWLARSAIADVMCATKDYASLNRLSENLFDEGDVGRAFRYAAGHCLPDAIFYGGKLRPWQIAMFFPQIQMTYQQESARQQALQRVMIIVLSTLVLVIGLLFIVLYQRQRIIEDTRLKLSESYARLEDQNSNLVAVNQKIMALNKELEEANSLKQSFIALFLSILSENISATRQYKNHVLRYIRRGAASDIAAEIENLPPIDEDIDEFYKMFDRTVMNIYPNFVEKFNGLLRDEERIDPRGDDLLSPELRIFALIRMGITDSSKIASLLHYSANTIYNYRAKTKNKAKGSREDFEDAVRAL